MLVEQLHFPNLRCSRVTRKLKCQKTRLYRVKDGSTRVRKKLFLYQQPLYSSQSHPLQCSASPNRLTIAPLSLPSPHLSCHHLHHHHHFLYCHLPPLSHHHRSDELISTSFKPAVTEICPTHPFSTSADNHKLQS